jgi:sugar phosphate permease
VDRRLFLGIVVILASLTMSESGVTDSLLVLGFMRVLHGMLNSSTNPLSFSLMSDYFPPEKRTFANSMI